MVPGSRRSSLVHDARDALPAPRTAAELALPLFRDQVAMLLFWLAIALPVCYLAMLSDGIGTTRELRSFLALFGLHVAALLGGRHHR